MKIILSIVMCCIFASTLNAQKPIMTGKTEVLDRPLPYPIEMPDNFKKAIKNGTRTSTGIPGTKYWSNKTAYTIKAVLSPINGYLTANEVIRYTNNSPDSLSTIIIQLRQNIYKPDGLRNIPLTLTNGFEIGMVRLNNEPLIQRRSRNLIGYFIDGSIMTVRLSKKIGTGESVNLTIDYGFELPNGDDGRAGQKNDIFFAGYWYPQISVYDDVRGWDYESYLGNGEFYMDYSNYEVEITVPEGYIVSATGNLQNSASVYSDSVLNRLRRAEVSNKIISIVGEKERFPGLSTKKNPNGQLTWKYKAQNVRDFAFTASNKFAWDAAKANTGENNILVQALYKPENTLWKNAAAHTRFSVETISKKIFPYPYSHMTSVDGVISGGMEFPMMTLLGGMRNDYSLFATIYHEVAHMWFPMLIGSDEKSFSWMDEGFTNFNEYEGVDAWKPDTLVWSFPKGYFHAVKMGYEVEPMRHADQFPESQRGFSVAAYDKPAHMLNALRKMLGQEKFYSMFSGYAKTWMNKHPMPFDFYNYVENQSGYEMDWFFRSYLYETWVLDQTIKNVVISNGNAEITIEDLGNVPMPVYITAVYPEFKKEQFIIPVDEWLKGKRTVKSTFKLSGTPVQFIIDEDSVFLDVDRSNNSWTVKQ